MDQSSSHAGQADSTEPTKPLAPDSHGFAIVQQELRLLGRVSNALEQLRGPSAAETPDFDGDLIALRNQIVEAKPEDVPPLIEQMTRISALAQRYGKGRDLPVDPSSPYFAHLRLSEDDRRRDVLIGKRGFVDRQLSVNIVDWRNAPVSRIYYRYEEEDDYEERFGDRAVEGTVEARRNLAIEHGRLRRVGCPQGTYVSSDGETWFEARVARAPELRGGQGKAARPPRLKRGDKRSRLGSRIGPHLRADKHLPEIAALIDGRQFDLITQPDSGLVVLQGGAGTGKTTVALHRVAYLNYQRPKLFSPDRMLVVAPSRAMTHYVERVLPALAVGGVRVVTARSWFERTRRRMLPHTTRTYNDDTPAVVLRFKKHPLLLQWVRDHVAEQQSEAHEALGAALKHEKGLRALWQGWKDLEGTALLPRLGQLRNHLTHSNLSASTRQHLDGLLRRLLRRASDLVADWGELLTNRPALASAVDRYAAGAFSHRELDRVCSWCARQELEVEPRDAQGEADENDTEASVAADGRRETPDTQGAALDRPDDALLLYLCWLKQGQLRPTVPRDTVSPGKALRYEHLVIDEAQDLAAIELKTLIETARPRYSVTLAGDTAQRLVFDNEFNDWESLLDRLEIPPTSNTTLELGYRSTDEVMALARELLGETAPAKAPTSTRHGAPVELHRFADQGEAVAMLGEALRSLVGREPLASVVLIAHHLAEAISYGEALTRAEVPGIRIVRAQDFSFRPGIEVTDVTQVKGLEFDYVVLLDVTAGKYPATVENRHLLHIAATRAAHQLWLISVGPPSPLLPITL